MVLWDAIIFPLLFTDTQWTPTNTSYSERAADKFEDGNQAQRRNLSRLEILWKKQKGKNPIWKMHGFMTKRPGSLLMTKVGIRLKNYSAPANTHTNSTKLEVPEVQSCHQHIRVMTLKLSLRPAERVWSKYKMIFPKFKFQLCQLLHVIRNGAYSRLWASVSRHVKLR